MSSSTPDADRNLPYHMHLEAAADEEIHVTVARAIAAATNQDPGATDGPLYDYVEPEALEQLYEHAEPAGGANWEFSFSVEDLTVTLDSDGQIVVT